jgi:hypothetical protein
MVLACPKLCVMQSVSVTDTILAWIKIIDAHRGDGDFRVAQPSPSARRTFTART